MLANNLVTTDNNSLDVNTIKSKSKNELLSLYFDGSKSKEGVVASCFLLDQKGNNFFFFCL